MRRLVFFFYALAFAFFAPESAGAEQPAPPQATCNLWWSTDATQPWFDGKLLFSKAFPLRLRNQSSSSRDYAGDVRFTLPNGIFFHGVIEGRDGGSGYSAGSATIGLANSSLSSRADYWHFHSISSEGSNVVVAYTTPQGPRYTGTCAVVGALN